MISRCDLVNYSDPFGLCPPVDATPCVAGTANFSEAAFRSIGQIVQKAQGPLEVASDAALLPVGGPEEAGAEAAVATGAAAEQTVGRLATKLGNQLSHLDRSHLSIAARELGGFVSGWDHVTEVREAAAGVASTIDKLKNFLSDPALTTEIRSAAQGLLGRASRALDATEKALTP